jgi:uncharacterized protein YndB with AHSA1/START domain
MPYKQTKHTDNQPIAKAAMLIRKPVAEVYEAFVNPDITSKFWFSRGTGRLDSGKEVEWFWDPYNINIKIKANELIKNELIAFSFPSPEVLSQVKMIFTPYSDNATFVTITEMGWDADYEKVFEVLVGQTEGWTLVLSSLKALLEQNIRLGVIFDRHIDKETFNTTGQ